MAGNLRPIQRAPFVDSLSAETGFSQEDLGSGRPGARKTMAYYPVSFDEHAFLFHGENGLRQASAGIAALCDAQTHPTSPSKELLFFTKALVLFLSFLRVLCALWLVFFDFLLQ